MTLAARSKVDVFPLASLVAQDGDEWDAEAAASGSPGPSIQIQQTQQTKDYSAQARLLRLKRRYDRDGGATPVRSVDGVILVHVHSHPHVLLFRQKARTLGVLPLTGQFSTGGPQAAFRLPGGKCRRDEGEVEAMYRKLGRHLLGEPKAPFTSGKSDRPSVVVGNTPGSVGGVDVANDENGADASRPQHASRATTVFRVGEVLALWHRPSFDRLMYPYIPAHVTQVKETRTLFLIHVMLDESAALRLTTSGGGGGSSSTLELVAVPLFELLDNAAKYGAVASSIPHIVSRLHINYC